MSIQERVEELALLARPGLPVIQRPIDNTASNTYKTCPREYFFAMYLHRRSNERSPALRFGSVWHKLLEVHYRTGGDRDAAITTALQSWDAPPGYDDYRNLERACTDYFQYIGEFGEPHQEAGKTVVLNDEPLIELPISAMGGDLIHPYAGKIDRIVELDGLYWAEDHKTTSMFTKYYFKQYEQSGQMMGYVHQAQQLLPGVKIQGVRINLNHCLTKKSAFYRELIPFSPEKLRGWAHTENAWMQKIARATEAYEEAVEAGVPPLEAQENAFPGHLGDNGCSRKFGLCGYFEVCSASPRLRDKMLVRNFPEQHPWNPLNIEGDDD